MQGDLTRQENLSTDANIKTLAFPEDVTFIIAKLYSPEYLATFPNMRTVLNLNLFSSLSHYLTSFGPDISSWTDLEALRKHCEDRTPDCRRPKHAEGSSAATPRQETSTDQEIPVKTWEIQAQIKRLGYF